MHQWRNFKFSPPPEKVVIGPPTCSASLLFAPCGGGSHSNKLSRTWAVLRITTCQPQRQVFQLRQCSQRMDRLILNHKRSSMAPYHANILSVIHDNYPKFFPINRRQAEQGSAVSVDWVDFDWIATSRNLLATRSSAISTFAWQTMPASVKIV